MWGGLYTKPGRIRQSDDLRLTELSVRRRDACTTNRTAQRRNRVPAGCKCRENPVFCLKPATKNQALGAGAGVSAGTGGAVSPDEGAVHDGDGAQHDGAGAQQVAAGAQHDDLCPQLPQLLLQHFVLWHLVLQHFCLQHLLPAWTSAPLRARPTTATTTAASDNSLRVIAFLLGELKYVKSRNERQRALTAPTRYFYPLA